MRPSSLPSDAFLTEIEGSFAAGYPESFRSFCRKAATAEKYPGLRRGVFIQDRETFEAINRQIGEEEWGDYERIIAGKQQPKTGSRLWGGMLPFYFEPPKTKRRRRPKLAAEIYGFDADEPGSAKVLVWSVHCIVHGFPTLEAWLGEFEK